MRGKTGQSFHRAIPVQQQFSVNLSLLQLLLSLLGSPEGLTFFNYYICVIK